ncbi:MULTISPECIES: hypothetical protein [Bradyrhizobium]|uniref:hypothetical protein n=1 Tax=Bradyrhizobium TaxID=374 RepID=UPI00195E9041|nr:hypothetical protein [Bradyrhizobium canariense]MBM7485190.1 hypothetical protein [Bradyrhizobium canariense]UFW73719.1 hypothetical protein BcanWU425_08190 [Bradyrhizobium canariense]
MSGQLRICFAGFVLAGGLWTTPSLSNPLAELLNTTSRQDAATSSAQAECLPRPDRTTADGTHWVYRFDGHRKCWFLTEGIAKVKKTVRHRGAQDRAANLDENGTARPRQSAVADARAELLRSAPAEPPVPEIKVADAASVLDMGIIMSSAAPTILHSGRLTPEHSVPDQVDVEQLLAPALAGSPPAMPMGARISEAHDEAHSWTATWLGVLLMTLGGFSILSSSRTLRHAVRLRQ